MNGEFLLPLLFQKFLPTTPALTNPPQALSSSALTTPIPMASLLFLNCSSTSVFLCSAHSRCFIGIGEGQREGAGGGIEALCIRIGLPTQNNALSKTDESLSL